METKRKKKEDKYMAFLFTEMLGSIQSVNLLFSPLNLVSIQGKG
jgi:hypothetical protein